MTAHQVELQLSQVSTIDTHVRQFSEACVDSVNRASLADDLLDHLPRSFDAFTRFCRQRNVLPARSNARDLLNGQRLTVELKHKSRPILKGTEAETKWAIEF